MDVSDKNLEHISKADRSIIKQLEEVDAWAFESSYSFVRPDLLINGIFILHDEIQELYQQVVEELTKDQREALSDSLQALRREFLFGNLTCLRAHSTDSENHRRKALEFCAFAVRMVNEPHAASVWLDAIKSKKKYRQYKNHFKIIPILKSASECGIVLDKLYDELCQEVHATPYAIKTQTRIVVDEKGRRINWLNYHDDHNAKERYSLAQRFLTGIYLDYGLLLVIADAIWKRFPGTNLSRWQEKKREYFDLYQSESVRIKQLPIA